MTFELRDIIMMLLFVSGIVASYFDAQRRIDKKLDKEAMQKIVNGIRLEIQNGMKEIVDSMHEIDKRLVQNEFRVKYLEDRDA